MARTQLTKEARLHRQTLFAGGHLPTYDEKWRVYEEIVNIYGCTGYTRHQHSNWYTGRERSRLKSPRSALDVRLHGNPNPTALEVARWALELEISEVDAFRLVGILLPDAVKALAGIEHLRALSGP